ncbi:MAG: hypothetical protein IT368_06430 [Candidatus Hydrogenedentes bacterium]|nr:hypothetical protein [Candidatus Hydrogenedentota bacterium]
MYPVIIMLPFIIVVVALSVTVIRKITAVWIEHRVKMALLEKVEHNPELIQSFNELQELLTTPAEPEETANRQDLALTGVLLSLIGGVTVVIALLAGSGRYAVGAYFGGVACVVLGFVLCLTGLLLRYLSRPPVERPRE